MFTAVHKHLQRTLIQQHLQPQPAARQRQRHPPPAHKKFLLGGNDYISTVRLQKAKFLLADMEYTISEVASMVGYSSQAYFSTVFKSKFCLTPSEYREKKRGGKTF